MPFIHVVVPVYPAYVCADISPVATDSADVEQ